MNFDDIKDRFRESLQGLWAQLQESSAFSQLQEKFQDLSPNAQKATLAGVSALFALFLFSIPWSFYSTSEESIEAFEDRKQLMRDLYRVTRSVNSLPQSPPPVSSSELRMGVENELQMANLRPEQKQSITDFNDPGKTGISKALQQSGIAVSLSKITIKQMTELGRKFEQIRPTVKMVGLDVRASKPDPHYFDVTYKLVAFTLPPEKAAGGKKPGGKNKF